jgi:hypothetical protein
VSNIFTYVTLLTLSVVEKEASSLAISIMVHIFHCRFLGNKKYNDKST